MIPKRLQTGTLGAVEGQISCLADSEVRNTLDETAGAMMTRRRQRSAVKAWDTLLAAKRGHTRAVIAVARKIEGVMHRMWIDGTTFRVSAVDRDGERRIGASAAVAQAA